MNTPDLKPHDYRRVILTTIKDEGPYLIDWLAYHLAIGFTHFVVMGNDNADGGDKILRALADHGLVTYAENKPPYPKGIQKTAYGRMRRFDAVKGAEWLLVLDLDEYFRVDLGDGGLEDLIAATGDAVAISLVWQAFGHNGVQSIIDEPVIAQFTRAAEDYLAQPYQIRGLKTLYRAAAFARIGTHRPIAPIAPLSAARPWFDGDFRRVNFFAEHGYWCAWNNGIAFGTRAGRINHYALRSKDSFKLKLFRGFSNRVNYGMRGADDPMNYWRIFDWNSVENTRILRHLAAANAIKAVLLGDARIKKWHEFAVNHHQALIASPARFQALADDEARAMMRAFEARIDAIAPQQSLAELAGTGLLNAQFPTMFSPEYLARIGDH